jgi:anaerobic sulfite reductase subunit B
MCIGMAMSLEDPMRETSMLPGRYRVVERRAEITDVVTLVLSPIDGAACAPQPGQFNMLWAFGVGEVPISLAGANADGTFDHTIRSVGATTAALCAAQTGAMVGLRGPFGHGFDLDAAAGRDLVVIAGGLGLAPLRPVVQTAMADRDRFASVSVLIGARSPDTVLYSDEFTRWRGSGIAVAVTVDSAGAGWNGEVGVVTKLLRGALREPTHAAVVLCGPEVMMRFAASELIALGVQADAIQVSLERNMHCALGQCGRCQLGPHFVCHDGPVFTWPRVVDLLRVRER